MKCIWYNRFLDSYGIEAVVFDDTISQVAPHYLWHQGGSRLMVRDTDVEAARTIVQNYQQAQQ
jgi:hypothetical protein